MSPEGRIILFPSILAALVLTMVLLLTSWVLLAWLVALIWCFVIFTLQFFRDPVRIPPPDEQVVLSPADGLVVAIEEEPETDFPQGRAQRISIFLSIFNVHSQRVPFDAEVVATEYRRGEFQAAYKASASIANEQAITTFDNNGRKFKVRQIAGLIARRILNHMEPGSSVKRGDRLGFIRFGSRVDLIVPRDFRPLVQVGDKVKGAISRIGYFADENQTQN